MTRWLPRTSTSAARIASFVAPAARRASPAARLAAGEREQEVLGRDVLVLHLVGLLRGGLPGVLERPAEIDVERGAMGARQLLERAIEVGADDPRVGAELAEDARHDAALLIEQRDEQVLGG